MGHWSALACVLCFFVSTVFGVQAQKVEIISQANATEVLLYFDAPYTLLPRISTQDEYKGVIFENASALRQNKRIDGSFLSEVQVFNINNNLYVLGIGDAQNINVEVSKSAQTFKVLFQKVTPTPTHLEILIDKTLQNTLDTTQSESISENILNLPKPESTAFIYDKEFDLSALKQNNPITQDLTTTDSSGATQDQRNLAAIGKNSFELETWRYFALIGIMVGFILLLLWVKKFIKPKAQNFATLIRDNASPYLPTLHADLKVTLQKKIDSKNRIVLVEANNYYYLVLLGERGNVLLDRYNPAKNQEINTHNDFVIDDTQFAKLLEQKEQRLMRLKNAQTF